MRRIVVVGGGAAGVPLATRLAEQTDATVILVEAGPTTNLPDDLFDGATLRGADPGHPQNWAHPAHLTPDRPWLVARGRAIGGSSAINGGSFVRARPQEFDSWATVGGPAWRYENMLPLLRAIETDIDVGSTAIHGGTGPMRVKRAGCGSPLVRAFQAGAVELGFRAETDKNAPGRPGVGVVPSTIVSGRRESTATAYLSNGHPSNLNIVGDTVVQRVRFIGHRAVGVEIEGGFIPADEVVLCAGAINSAHILLVSGVGPRPHLEALGISVVADLPVGSAFSDHADVALAWRAETDLSDEHGSPFPATLDFAGFPDGCDDTDLEIVLTTRPMAELFGENRKSAQIHELTLIVSLQSPRSRGSIRAASAHPADAAVIQYGYLADEHDRALLRTGVRTAANLLLTSAFAHIFRGFVDIDHLTLTDDARLDAWIHDHLGTAIHLSGSAPMGDVVDGEGRVHGVTGLRVADTSILPTVPTRGPYATAVLIGEYVARMMLHQR